MLSKVINSIQSIPHAKDFIQILTALHSSCPIDKNGLCGQTMCYEISVHITADA